MTERSAGASFVAERELIGVRIFEFDGNGGQLEVPENSFDDLGFLDGRENCHGGAADFAGENINIVHTL